MDLVIYFTSRKASTYYDILSICYLEHFFVNTILGVLAETLEEFSCLFIFLSSTTILIALEDLTNIVNNIGNEMNYEMEWLQQNCEFKGPILSKGHF